MKTMRNLFLLCAGLSLFACSSDDDATQQFPEGNGAVEVRIVNPAARAGNTTINIEGTLTVTLIHANGELSQTVTIGDDDQTTTKTVKFWNVVNPSLVKASINGGIASYTSIAITQESGEGGNLQAVPKNIPAYGESATFTKQQDKMSATDQDQIGNNGYKDGDAGKDFTKYTAGITMAIPVARLEVGAISHVQHQSPQTCTFSELFLKGVYLDDVAQYGGTYSDNTFSKVDGNDVSGIDQAILKKTVDSPTDATFAASAFNFYGTNGTPTFKVYFSSAKFAEGTEADLEREGWAMITKYINSETQEEITNFENGKVYQISAVTLLDKNIVGSEENDEVFGVEVTVTEAVWEVVPTSAEWAE